MPDVVIDVLRWVGERNPLLILLMMFGAIVLFIALGTFVSDAIERLFPRKKTPEGDDYDGW